MKRILTLICLLLISCSEEAEHTDQVSHHKWDTSFFAPRPGEKSIYRKTTESISTNQEKPIFPDDITKSTYERIQTYEGTEIISGKVYHKHSISINGQPKPGYLIHWDGNTIIIAGSFSKGKVPQITKNPIPIAKLDMLVGTYWHWPKGAPFGSGSRVISLESVKVPAGTFQAYKVAIKKTPSGEINLREYWFAPKVGIVKERNHVYSKGILRSRSTIDLMERHIPD